MNSVDDRVHPVFSIEELGGLFEWEWSVLPFRLDDGEVEIDKFDGEPACIDDVLMAKSAEIAFRRC